MRYYIRPLDKVEVRGPFEVEELNRQIAKRIIDSDWLATSDLGESLDAIKRSSEEDWFWIAEIPGVIGVEKLKQFRQRSQPKFTLVTVIVLVVLIAAFLFFGFFALLRIWLGDIH